MQGRPLSTRNRKHDENSNQAIIARCARIQEGLAQMAWERKTLGRYKQPR